MKLVSIKGKVLFEGRFATVRRAVEAAVVDNVDLSGVNLRGALLNHAALDGARLRGACLWGARLNNTQLCESDCAGADFRMAQFKDSCLAESDCRGADMRGAYFAGTIVRAGQFDHCQFSCPSVFSVPWEEAAGLTGATYWHKGEIECPLSRVPLVISGLPQRVVMMEQHILVGTQLHSRALLPLSELQNANRP